MILIFKEYKNIFDNITFFNDKIRYLEYNFFIWYINNNEIKDEMFKKIVENINNTLKKYILNMDGKTIVQVVMNTLGLTFTIDNLNIINGIDYIETDNYSQNYNIYNFTDLSKYFIDNKELIFISINKSLNYDNYDKFYFIKEIIFEKVMIAFKYNENILN